MTDYRARQRGSRGQVLGGALLALIIVASAGAVLVALGEQSVRAAERSKRRLVSGFRADAGLVAARLELEQAMVDSDGSDARDGATAQGEVPSFLNDGDARWEWEVRVIRDGAYWRTTKFIRGYGSYRGQSQVVWERQLRSYSLLNYSWFTHTGSQSFGVAFRSNGAIYAGGDLNFNHNANQYFGSRVEASGGLLNRGNDESESRTFALASMPRSGVPQVVLDTDVDWFQNTYDTASHGGIVLPTGYDYAIDFTGADLTQAGTLTIKRRARQSTDNSLSTVRTSNSGTWTDYTMTIPSNFNGVIFAGAVGSNGNPTAYSSVKVKGTLQRMSTTVVATDDAFIWGNTYGGTTNGDFNRDGRHPENDSAGTGDPVNLALVAMHHIRIAKDAPRILEFEVASCAVEGTIKEEYYNSSFNDSDTNCNPIVSPYDANGTLTGWDLDMNGTIETSNSEGWNERTLAPTHGGQTVGSKIYHLETSGPLIGNGAPSMNPWAYYPQLYNSRPHNRDYNYNPSILRYPPPAFPAALNLNTPSAWVERKPVYGTIEGLEFLAPQS